MRRRLWIAFVVSFAVAVVLDAPPAQAITAGDLGPAIGGVTIATKSQQLPDSNVCTFTVPVVVQLKAPLNIAAAAAATQKITQQATYTWALQTYANGNWSNLSQSSSSTQVNFRPGTSTETSSISIRIGTNGLYRLSVQGYGSATIGSVSLQGNSNAAVTTPFQLVCPVFGTFIIEGPP